MHRYVCASNLDTKIASSFRKAPGRIRRSDLKNVSNLGRDAVGNVTVDAERPPTQERLSWNSRIKIAIGSARGIAYLHHDCVPRIIHRDIKSSNVLLDDMLEPHVSDFGLAKLLEDDSSHVTTIVAGTFGYLAPGTFLHVQIHNWV